MSLRELARKAVMILEDGEIFTLGWKEEAEELANALRAALAEPQPQPEPVAWRVRRDDGQYELYFVKAMAKRAAECYIKPPQVEPLYTTPPQRQPLTDEEIARLWSWAGKRAQGFARALEKAHGIGGDK